MIGHLKELGEIWDTLDTCYERPKKYMKALKPILEFRKYRVFDSSAIREFYFILRAAIKGAKSIGRLDLLINDQTVPKIMGKMPFSDWKEWATKRPEWIRGDLGLAFEGFVERKWRDALNVAAAKPQAWEAKGPKRDRSMVDKAAGTRVTGERAAPGQKGPTKTVGTANVVTQQPAWRHKQCRVQEQTGCEGDHLVLRCSKLQELSICDRKKVLEASLLCMFCLRHPANAECFDQGGRSKPACVQRGCKGKHAAGVHDLLGGVESSVNLASEEGDEEDEGDLYVNVARIGQEEDDWQEPDDSWLDLDGGESEDEGRLYCISAFTRKGDSGLEEELEYFSNITPNEDKGEEAEEDRWWSPELTGLQSEEEDEEDNRYINSILSGKYGTEGKQALASPPRGHEADSDSPTQEK
jgi:hypothetical protein